MGDVISSVSHDTGKATLLPNPAARTPRVVINVLLSALAALEEASGLSVWRSSEAGNRTPDLARGPRGWALAGLSKHTAPRYRQTSSKRVTRLTGSASTNLALTSVPSSNSVTP